MPRLDLIDETFIVATPAQAATAAHEPDFWAQLWPGLVLTVVADRGVMGISWECADPLPGSAEVWLEAHGAGVIIHCYLRVDPPAAWSAGRLRRESRRRQLQVKGVTFALKDRLEAGYSSAGAVLPTSER